MCLHGKARKCELMLPVEILTELRHSNARFSKRKHALRVQHGGFSARNSWGTQKFCLFGAQSMATWVQCAVYGRCVSHVKLSEFESCWHVKTLRPKLWALGMASYHFYPFLTIPPNNSVSFSSCFSHKNGWTASGSAAMAQVAALVQSSPWSPWCWATFLGRRWGVRGPGSVVALGSTLDKPCLLMMCIYIYLTMGVASK